jgi:hypothetical protein
VPAGRVRFQGRGVDDRRDARRVWRPLIDMQGISDDLRHFSRRSMHKNRFLN